MSFVDKPDYKNKVSTGRKSDNRDRPRMSDERHRGNRLNIILISKTSADVHSVLAFFLFMEFQDLAGGGGCA